MYTWPMHLHAQFFGPHVQWIEEKSYLDHGHSMQRFIWIVTRKRIIGAYYDKHENKTAYHIVDL